MNRRLATVAAVCLLAAGCAGNPDNPAATVETKQAQLQAHVDGLDVLQLELQGVGTAADTSATTFLAPPRDAVSSTSSLTSAMVDQIRLVLTRGTAVRDLKGSLVVTLDDPRGYTWKVASDVEPASATFTLQVKPQGSSDLQYVTVVSGQATRTQASRQGALAVDLDALKTVVTSAGGQGQLFIAFVADSGSRRVCARLTHFTFGLLHAPVDASLAVSVQLGSFETRVHYEYASSGVLGARTATHQLRIVPGVGGRGELKAADGTTGSIDSTACWNRQNQTLYVHAKTCVLGVCTDLSVSGKATECDSVLGMEAPLAVGAPRCEGTPPQPPEEER